MDDLKIEAVTFYKQISYSTQIFEKNLGPSSVMSISLPRVKFLEAEGDYKPAWAIDVERMRDPEPIREMTPEQKKLISKNTFRRRAMHSGMYEISELEQTVHDLMQQGMTKEEVCKKLNRTSSSIGGAIGRFKAKTLAKQNKK